MRMGGGRENPSASEGRTMKVSASGIPNNRPGQAAGARQECRLQHRRRQVADAPIEMMTEVMVAAQGEGKKRGNSAGKATDRARPKSSRVVASDADADSDGAAFACRVLCRHHVGSDRSITRMSQALRIAAVEESIVVKVVRRKTDTSGNRSKIRVGE